MGIERFFNSLVKNKTIKENGIDIGLKNKINADYVYIDFNSVIYNIITDIEHDLNYLLYDIILGKNISIAKLDKFKMAHVKTHKNEKGRHFPRTSKKPHSKWHLKSYSSNSQLKKIINKIISNDIASLNKNLKVKANRVTILEINGKKYCKENG